MEIKLTLPHSIVTACNLQKVVQKTIPFPSIFKGENKTGTEKLQLKRRCEDTPEKEEHRRRHCLQERENQ